MGFYEITEIASKDGFRSQQSGGDGSEKLGVECGRVWFGVGSSL